MQGRTTKLFLSWGAQIEERTGSGDFIEAVVQSEKAAKYGKLAC